MKLAHAAVLRKEVPQSAWNEHSATPAARVRFRTGNVLIYLSSLLLVGSAAAKLLQVPPVLSGMAVLGFYGGKLTFIALLEILSALLFVFARTRSFGLLMVSAYLGGAVAVHVAHDQLPLQPAFVLALIWLGAWLRYPRALFNAL